MHETGDARGDDAVGLGFLEDGVEFFLDKGDSFIGEIVGESPCAAAALVFPGKGIYPW